MNRSQLNQSRLAYHRLKTELLHENETARTAALEGKNQEFDPHQGSYECQPDSLEELTKLVTLYPSGRNGSTAGRSGPGTNESNRAPGVALASSEGAGDRRAIAARGLHMRGYFQVMTVASEIPSTAVEASKVRRIERCRSISATRLTTRSAKSVRSETLVAGRTRFELMPRSL